MLLPSSKPLVAFRHDRINSDSFLQPERLVMVWSLPTALNLSPSWIQESHTRLLDSVEKTNFVVTGLEDPVAEHPFAGMLAFV